MSINSRTPDQPLEATLPSNYYYSDDYFQKDLGAIFYKTWLCAGRVSDVANVGDFLTLEVGSQNIIITRDTDNKLQSFHNTCRHRGSQLCKASTGCFERNTIRCCYHGWSYDLTGNLIGAPRLQENEHFTKSDFPLYKVTIDTWGGFIFINLSSNPEPLLKQLDYLPEKLKRYPLETLIAETRQEKIINANWKILVENYMECYHCPLVHPELCELMPLYRTGEVISDQAGVEFGGDYFTWTTTGKSNRPVFKNLNKHEAKAYVGEMILPHIFLNALPDVVHVRTLWPISATQTKVISLWLFEPETIAQANFDSSDAVDFLGLVGKQDWQVCEAVQKGLKSKAHKNGVCLPQEEYVLDFKHWVLQHYDRL
jgi:Rieske 2Fe-2S family protein